MMHPRRGVLLLVVLSVLTLFLMLGATYLAVATRARRASRAFADNVVAATANSASQVRLLDEAFWTVARGTLATGTGGAPVAYLGAGEDLLGDKYGAATVTGRVSAAAQVASSPALLKLTCSATSGAPANVSDYAGRVVSLMLPGLSTSTRIVSATGSPSSPTLFIPGGPTVTGEVLSDTRITAAIAKSGTTPATTLIINGREFDDSGTNEPYDGYDSVNPLLTRLAMSGSALKTGTAYMYTVNPTALTYVDNDGDGQVESGFIDIGLPPILDSSGQIVYPQAAVLVADLDGRLNVNAHGGATDAQTVGRYPTLNPTGTNAVMRIDRDTVPLYQLPRGATPGPADVSLSRSLVFADKSSPPTTENDSAAYAAFSLAGRTISGSNSVDRATSREVPKVGGIEGRFGDGMTVGLISTSVGTGFPNTNDIVSRKSDMWRATVDTSGTTYVTQKFHEAPGRYGSPWDLKGRMRLWVDEFGQPVYFKPSWSTAGTTDDDVVDDPYEVNLTRLGSRAAYSRSPTGSAPADNIFTPAELEGLLRFFDPDSMKLSRRLVAINERNASSNRLLLTTESWDTPAVVGKAWRTVIGGTFSSLLSATDLAAPNRPQDFFSAETLMGHRLDLNRPFHDAPNYDEPNDATGTARRQLFARHLYCLMVAIAHKNDSTISATPSRRDDIARQIAQYAINIVDYRDGDSVMTQFKYDPSFTLGSSTWAPGTDDYVWGCERPELLITETLAWHDRCTDDTASDPTGKKVVDVDSNGDGLTDGDDDFDQRRRPRGAFFVELYSPWRARTAVYDTVSGSSVIRSGSNTLAEPIAAALRTSGSAGFDTSQTTSGTVLNSTITLNHTVSGCPVWRLVSVRGDVQGGTAFDNATKNIVDPSAPGSSAVVDRVFYFGNLTSSGTALKNPANLKDGKPGAIFWTTGSSSIEPSQAQYVVVGTYGLGFDYRKTPFTGTDLASGTSAGLSYANTIHLGFDSPSTATTLRPATLSEPVNTASTGSGTVPNQDPYELLSTGSFGPKAGVSPSNIYDANAELTNPLDKPLDENLTGASGPVSESFRVSNADMIAAEPLVAGKPLLMFNGTHENFAVLHLQRLADPTRAWDSSTNPYITVDSMPTDLTVVNTATDGHNYDEPGKTPYDVTNNTPGPTALTWLQTRKNYRYQTVERGGKPVGSPNVERDIWNRRVNAAANALSSGTTLVSGTTVITGTSPYASRPVVPTLRADPLDPMPVDFTNLLKNPTPAPASLIQISSAATTLTGTTDHTLREYATQTEIQSRPARFLKTPGPLFPWLAWPNKPFASTIDLALVPVTSPFELPARHSTEAFKAPTPNFFHLPRFFESTAPEGPWDLLAGRKTSGDPSIFDFVHIPSPFAAVYTTVPPTTSGSAALQTVGLDIFPINQISNFREPGRVNVNTIPDRKVWRALFGAANVMGVDGDANNPDDPDFTPSTEQPARDRIPGWTVELFAKVESDLNGALVPETPTRVPTITDFFKYLPNRNSTQRQATPAPGGFVDRFVRETNEDDNFNGELDAGEDDNNNGVLDQNDANKNGVYDINQYRNTDLNAYFRYQTMRQLSNVITTRSHVFGVWITLRYVDSSGFEVTPIQRNRAFYIFDRSIPVAYEKGKNHNVQDAVLLRRIIQ